MSSDTAVRPVVIIVPGFASSADLGVMEPLAALMRALGNQVEYAPTVRAMSYHEAGNAEKVCLLQAQAILDLLEKNDFRNVILLGHSLGAVWAAKAATMTDRVLRLLLIAPAAWYDQSLRQIILSMAHKTQSNLRHTDISVARLGLQQVYDSFKYVGAGWSRWRLALTEIEIARGKMLCELLQALNEQGTEVWLISGLDDHVFPSHLVASGLQQSLHDSHILYVPHGVHDLPFQPPLLLEALESRSLLCT